MHGRPSVRAGASNQRVTLPPFAAVLDCCAPTASVPTVSLKCPDRTLPLCRWAVAKLHTVNIPASTQLLVALEGALVRGAG